MILGKMKEIAVSILVKKLKMLLSRYQHFNDSQGQAKDAGVIAGLELELLINQRMRLWIR